MPYFTHPLIMGRELDSLAFLDKGMKTMICVLHFLEMILEIYENG